jgi:secretion/DNA translocation related TadE-like protein
MADAVGRAQSAAGRWRGRRPERGIATILAIGWIAVLSSAGAIAMLAAVVTAAQHRLDGAADLAALAAAEADDAGQADVCGSAARIAVSNGATVRSCERDRSDVVVTVVGAVDLPWGLDGSLTATSRAGP